MDRSQTLATRQPISPPRPDGLPGAKRVAGGPQTGAGALKKPTIISKDLTIEGNISSTGVVHLEGTLLGNVECASFTLEKTGILNGKVVADEVKMHGQHEGSIKGGQVMLFADAEVKGDIVHEGISIEMGARYEGRLKAPRKRAGKAKPQVVAGS